ncbi:MAG: HNH endonuclease [Actinobacteria bacterium]|nr:HNH endonuclease [Actinomycetota bacterium]
MAAATETDTGFDSKAFLDELRTHTSEWLCTFVHDLLAQQRALRVKELLARRVLDERQQVDLRDDVLQSRHGESPRTARQNVELARQLEALPAIAAAAHAGLLSADQLRPLAELATPETDAEWARRGPNCSPVDLERMARSQRGVTSDEAAARREARELRWWWEPGSGMLGVRGRLPDVEGALVKSVLERMVERMKPPKGEPWDTRAHRGADALVDLCKNYSDATPGPLRAHITFHVPPQGPPEVDGVAIASDTLSALLDDATVSNVTIDDGVLWGARTDTECVPAETSRFVRARDVHCRVGSCDESRGLEEHHLIPQCEGGSHDPQNLVLAGRPCGHHQMLVPNGPYRLEGHPSRPDGLTLVRVDRHTRAP